MGSWPHTHRKKARIKRNASYSVSVQQNVPVPNKYPRFKNFTNET